MTGIRFSRRTMPGIRRRTFTTLLGGAAAWPIAARAQQVRHLPTIGYVAPTNPLIPSQSTSAFLQRLRELGWIEGQTITIESRWTAGHPERLDEIAAEFVQLKVDLIVTSSTNDSIVMKQVAPQIPMVFAVSGDPVGYGLVASLARPGGNVTGLSMQSPDLASKRIQLLREIVPGLHRLGILANPSSPSVMPEVSEVQAAALTVGLNAATSEIRQTADIDSTFELLKSRADALYVVGDPLVNTNRILIGTLALGARLPMMCGFRELVAAGCLMSYGPNLPDLYRRAAEFADRILRGARPSDIPVEQPIKFELVINLKTAKALGLDVPLTLLAIADDVIK
jgi:putative tryptophan/tyrosine transport system substrate-binding protein